jgi:hypothetical protein
VDIGGFADAVTGLRADFDENPLTKGVMSSDQAMRGFKAAMDAALGRGSQALTEDRGPQVKLRHIENTGAVSAPISLDASPLPREPQYDGTKERVNETSTFLWK